jgi:UDP-N-acetyl-D-glucosamine dehydrogenase
VDPLFLRSVGERTGVVLPLIDLAHQRIRSRPLTVVGRLRALFRDCGTELTGCQVLMVGVAYKPGVADTRNAPAIDIISALRAEHAKVSYTDPMVTELMVDDEPVPRVEWKQELVSAFDCLVLTTPHPELLQRPLWYVAPLLLDCWHVVDPAEGVVHL